MIFLILNVCHTKPTINLYSAIASTQVEVKLPSPPNPSIRPISSLFSDDKMCFLFDINTTLWQIN